MNAAPTVPTTAIGSSAASTTFRPPVVAIASRVSFLVSTNSGANVAGASGP